MNTDNDRVFLWYAKRQNAYDYVPEMTTVKPDQFTVARIEGLGAMVVSNFEKKDAAAQKENIKEELTKLNLAPGTWHIRLYWTLPAAVVQDQKKGVTVRTKKSLKLAEKFQVTIKAPESKPVDKQAEESEYARSAYILRLCTGESDRNRHNTGTVYCRDSEKDSSFVAYWINYVHLNQARTAAMNILRREHEKNPFTGDASVTIYEYKGPDFASGQYINCKYLKQITSVMFTAPANPISMTEAEMRLIRCVDAAGITCKELRNLLDAFNERLQKVDPRINKKGTETLDWTGFGNTIAEIGHCTNDLILAGKNVAEASKEFMDRYEVKRNSIVVAVANKPQGNGIVYSKEDLEALAEDNPNMYIDGDTLYLTQKTELLTKNPPK